MGKICKTCGIWHTHIRTKSKFCSLSCYHKSTDSHIGKFRAGHIPFRNQKGSKNSNWRGNNVGYSGLHKWVRKTLGYAQKCYQCEKVGMYSGQIKMRWNIEWANISRRYKRLNSDWIPLCRRCHRLFDLL